MVRILLRTVIFVGSAALGLLAAWLILPDFDVTFSGFIVSVLIFALAQSILSPFVAKMVARNAPAFLGGIGLVSTFVALLIASLFTGGLVITGVSTWLLATLIVWLVTALATLFLPILLIKDKLERRRATPKVHLG
jgi:MFS family permease